MPGWMGQTHTTHAWVNHAALTDDGAIHAWRECAVCGATLPGWD